MNIFKLLGTNLILVGSLLANSNNISTYKNFEKDFIKGMENLKKDYQ